MRILIYDTETNSLDTETAYVKELAWAVYDSDSWRCLFAKSSLIAWPTYYDDPPEAIRVNGLTREFCIEHGRKPAAVFSEFLGDIEKADTLCGHNAIPYDRPVMRTNIKRGMLFDVPTDHTLNTKLHIDTLLDCPYPVGFRQMSLKYLAYDHGVILSDAHQALADVFACKGILCKYPLDKVIEISKTKLVTITAKIDFKDTDNRDKIKNARFYWNPNRKLWEKRIREYYLSGIQQELEGVLIQSSDL